MIVGTIQQEENSSWQEASNSWMELDEGEESGVYCDGTCQGVSSQLPEVGGEHSSKALHHSEDEEDEEIIEGGWWSPDPKELQIGEGEQEYLIELLMVGSASGESKATPERPPRASNTMGQPAKKGEAMKPEAQSQGEARGNKPVTNKEKGRSSEGASKGEGKPGIRTGGKETGARSEEGPKEWWPSDQKQEGPPNPCPSLGAKNKSDTNSDPAGNSGAQTQITTASRGECSGP
jgi:hypothetical protein